MQFYKENGFIQLSNIFSEGEAEEFSKEYSMLFQIKAGADLETAWRGTHMNMLTNDKKVTVSIGIDYNI